MALDQAIDAQIEHLLPQEIAGAYHALCAMVLVQTAVAFRTRVRRKDEASNKRVARQWLASGDEGVLTFAECCEAVNVSEEEARAGFTRIADGHLDKSIKRMSGDR